MKLYVIKNSINDKVLAITEYKYHAELFYLQNSNQHDTFIITKITSDKKINKYLVLYENLYLEEIEDYVVTREDLYILNSIIDDYKMYVKNTITSLENIALYSNLSSKEFNNINETISLLRNGIKGKKKKKFIDVGQIIRTYYSIPSISEHMRNNYNAFISHID